MGYAHPPSMLRVIRLAETNWAYTPICNRPITGPCQLWPPETTCCPPFSISFVPSLHSSRNGNSMKRDVSEDVPLLVISQNHTEVLQGGPYLSTAEAVAHVASPTCHFLNETFSERTPQPGTMQRQPGCFVSIVGVINFTTRTDHPGLSAVQRLFLPLSSCSRFPRSLFSRTR